MEMNLMPPSGMDEAHVEGLTAAFTGAVAYSLEALKVFVETGTSV